MKKTVTAILCLALVLGITFTLSACGSNIAGRYNLTAMEMNGETIDVESLKAFSGSDAEMYIELNSDGTAVMNMDGEISELQYADGKIWPTNNTDDKISFTVEDGVLTIEQDGMKLIFKK